MSAAPFLSPQPAPRVERRYWLDDASLQTLLDLMFSYVSGDRAHGTEEYLGWRISWETRYEPRLYLRSAEAGDEHESIPAGYTAVIQAPGLVTDANIDRILRYLEEQGLSAIAYEQDATSFEFTI